MVEELRNEIEELKERNAYLEENLNYALNTLIDFKDELLMLRSLALGLDHPYMSDSEYDRRILEWNEFKMKLKQAVEQGMKEQSPLPLRKAIQGKIIVDRLPRTGNG